MTRETRRSKLVELTGLTWLNMRRRCHFKRCTVVYQVESDVGIFESVESDLK